MFKVVIVNADNNTETIALESADSKAVLKKVKELLSVILEFRLTRQTVVIRQF